MKKRVRVYKAGGQSNKLSQQQIEAYLTQQMSADDYDGDTDALKDDLAGAGIDEDVADEYITSVSNDLGLNQDIVSIEEQQRLADEQAQLAVDQEQALLEQQEAADQARQAQLAAMYDTNIDMSTTEDTPEDEEALYAKLGGSKPSKRTFIKQYTKYAKMAQGGNTPSPGADDVLNGREDLVRGFQNALQGSAQDAILKQEAEAQYQYAFGGIKMGEFQEGGIHQEEIDPENFYHHLNLYGQEAQGVFADNQNIKSRQFGGFTDTDSGLYKFIGGGDNESFDEQYQDSDIDFNQEEYAKGGAPRRLNNRDLTARGYYSESGQKIAAPNAQGKAITSVDYLNKNIFGMPRQVRYNYGPGTPQPASPTTPTVNTPAGEYMPPNQLAGRRQPLANMMMRSGIPGVKQLGAHMTRSGMIPEIPEGTQPNTTAPVGNGDYYPPMDARAQRREARDDSRLNRFLGQNADVNAMNDPEEIKRVEKRMPGFQPFAEAKAEAKVEDRKEEAKAINKEEEKINTIVNPSLQGESVQAAINNNTIGGLNKNALNYDYGNDPAAREFQNKYPSFANRQRNDEFWSQQQPQGANQYSPEKAAKMKAMGLNPDIYGHHYLYQNPDKFKEFGGPIDYTEYAYGGDVSVPELYRAQLGAQTNAFDPNANPLGTKKDYKGDTVDFTGKVIKKRDSNFSFGEDATKLKNPFERDENSMNPLTGEKAGVVMNSEGAYTDDGLVDEAAKNEDGSYSQLFDVNKKNRGKNISAIGQGLGYGLKVGLNINDMLTAKDQENQLMANITSAESQYGVSNKDIRGDHDQEGNFRPDQTFKGKYGGGVYATGGSTEDEDEDIQYMTQEEIDEFRANGGELEFY